MSNYLKLIMRCITQMSDIHECQNHHLRLPETLCDQIKELAKGPAKTKSFLAIDTLTNYVQLESWQIRDIQEGIKEADAGEFATEEQVKAVLDRAVAILARQHRHPSPSVDA